MEILNICKSYDGRQVLHNISASLPQGSICAVLGASGSGKTTLLRILMGLEAPDSGTLADMPDRVSVLFQEDRLLPALTLKQNLQAVIRQPDPAGLRELCCRLGLSDSLDKPIREYSGGMARRAALARALLAPGELLILDEPFTGLDAENRTAAADAIAAWQSGRTLLYTAHDAPAPLLPPPGCILHLHA